MAYVAGAVDPVNRFRFELGDTTAFVDAEIQRWLDQARSEERLLIFLPTGKDGATGATVKSAVAGAGDPPPLELTLQRTIAGEAADVLELAPSAAFPYLEDVVDWIAGLKKGWCVGFRIGRDTEWPSLSAGWIDRLVTTSRFPRYAPAINLAPTRSADGTGVLTAYGAQADAAELHFLSLFGAVARGLEMLNRNGTSVQSRRDGDMAVSFDLGGRLAAVRRLAAEGIYAA